MASTIGSSSRLRARPTRNQPPTTSSRPIRPQRVTSAPVKANPPGSAVGVTVASELTVLPSTSIEATFVIFPEPVTVVTTVMLVDAPAARSPACVQLMVLVPVQAQPSPSADW